MPIQNVCVYTVGVYKSPKFWLFLSFQIYACTVCGYVLYQAHISNIWFGFHVLNWQISENHIEVLYFEKFNSTIPLALLNAKHPTNTCTFGNSIQIVIRNALLISIFNAFTFTIVFVISDSGKLNVSLIRSGMRNAHTLICLNPNKYVVLGV